MNPENFHNAVALLEEHFGKKLSDAAMSVWYEYLSQYISDAGLVSGVKFAIAESRFMPTAKELVEFSRQAAQEKSQMYHALPAKDSGFSDEDVQENLRRINEMCRQVGKRKRDLPKPDYEKMARDLSKAWEMGNK